MENTELNSLKNQKLEVYQEGFVVLPYGEEQFKKFVIGLLGRPQSIESNLSGNFVFEINDIQNIIHLLNQRINQQNGGNLIQLFSCIKYSDGSSVSLNSIEELLTYSEVRPIVTESLSLSFQYLLQFKDKDVPEKQEINITITASNFEEENYLERRYAGSIMRLFQRFIFKPISTEGEIQILIKHTARTWGNDIETLLVNYFKHFLIPEKTFQRIIKDNLGFISFLVALLVLLIGVYCSNSIDKINEESLRTNLSTLFTVSKQTDLQQISNELKFIAEKLILEKNNLNKLSGSLFPLLTILSFFITYGSIYRKRKSHLLLSKESYKFKQIEDKKYNYQWLIFFGSIILNISLNLIASWIFLVMSKPK